VFGTKLHAVVEDAERTADRIRQRLEESRNAPAGVERVVPSLEDVFIHCIESDDKSRRAS